MSLCGNPDVEAGVWKGSGTIHVDSRGAEYSATVEAYIAEDGRFVFHLDNHWAFEGQDIVFSYDGEDFYYMIRNAWHRGEGDLTYLATGSMPLIYFQDCARDALWYALGARDFLVKGGASGEIVNLTQGPRSSINSYGFRYEANILSQEPILAENMRIYNDKSLDRETPELEASRIELDLESLYVTTDRLEYQWQVKQDWPDGALAVEMNWDESERLGSDSWTILLPTEFSLKTYPVSGEPGAEPGWVVRGFFQSWEFFPEHTVSFKPAIHRRTRIYDSRLRQRTDTHYVSHVLYLIDDDLGWRSTEDPELQEMFHDSLLNKEIPVVGNRRDRRLILFILGSIFAALLPILLVVFGHQKST